MIGGKVRKPTGTSPLRKLADPERENWSAADVAAYFEVSEDTVVSEAKKGSLPAFKLGHQWRFKSARIRAIGTE